MVGTAGRELTTIGRRISWLRVRKKPMVPTIAVLGAAAIVILLALTPGVTRFPGFLRGLVAGVAATTVMGALAWNFLISDGSATWRVGALGEFWTSEELRKLGRWWTVMNGLRVPGADGSTREIDHVAVGPGGVLVVQTKLWPRKARQVDVSGSPEINGAAIDAQHQAAVVKWFLGDLVDSSAMSASLVLWGSDLLSASDPVAVNRRGVHIVHGRDAAPWRRKVAAIERLNDATIVTVLEVGAMLDRQPASAGREATARLDATKFEIAGPRPGSGDGRVAVAGAQVSAPRFGPTRRCVAAGSAVVARGRAVGTKPLPQWVKVG
jgi:Nuclease-related domain